MKYTIIGLVWFAAMLWFICTVSPSPKHPRAISTSTDPCGALIHSEEWDTCMELWSKTGYKPLY